MPPALYQSTIPAAKGALVALLDAIPALAGNVTWGVPRDAGAGREWIMVGDVRGEQSAGPMGRRPHHRDERYTIVVLIDVVRSNLDSPQSTAERAFELAAYAEDAIRRDPNLGLNVGDVSRGRLEAYVSRTDLTEPPGDGQERSARVTMFVECVARI